jgi:DNA-binding MarR family transcriptional regulator
MVNIYKLELTILQQEIMRLLYMNVGHSLNARRIAQSLNVTQPAISKAIPSLLKRDMIKVTKEKTSKRLDILLNTENPHVLLLKRAENLKLLVESGFIQFVYDSFPGATVRLFGSYAFGEDTVSSDVDIAVVGIKEKYVDTEKYSKILGKEIIINYYSSWNSIDIHLKNNILNGITLKGAVEL